ncbi:MAG: catechol 2,3-dioxygenase-like lactoylglutathione lyase family enzyme [Oceanicoccus sp.]|jgi:catechol 2,3-dioxygenase-like lactoylglutathione lyase family enzyme
MLQLEHLNLVVKDIAEALKFYEAAFPHWQIRGGGENEWYGKPRKWLHFGDDYQYLAFADNGVDENRNLKGHQIGLAHFAFVTHGMDDLVKRLQSAGYEIAITGAENAYRKNVYFIDPDGFEVEFVEYLTDQPELRNQY